MKRILTCISRLFFFLNRASPTHAFCDAPVSRREFLFSMIGHYGFIECNNVKIFLHYCCSENIFRAEATYIEEKLGECLLNHDNGGEYFEKMKAAYELVSAISRGTGHDQIK